MNIEKEIDKYLINERKRTDYTVQVLTKIIENAVVEGLKLELPQLFGLGSEEMEEMEIIKIVNDSIKNVSSKRIVGRTMKAIKNMEFNTKRDRHYS